MKAIKFNNNITGVICAITCEIVFGLSYIFTKNATNSASAFALLGWRFILAIAVMGLLVLFKVVKINLKGKSIFPLILVAMGSPCLYFIGETIGISNTTVSESGVFLACIPVASLIASTLILKKKPNLMQIIGIAVTLLGVIITVLTVGTTSSFSFLGYAFLLLAIIGYALYSVFVEKASNYTGQEITFIMLVVGAIFFGSVAIIEAIFKGTLKSVISLPFHNSDFLIAILFQGIGCSVISFFLSNVAISKIGVNRASSFIGVSTIVSIISGVLFLKEEFSAFQIVGAIVIVAGIYIANIKKKEQ